MQLVMLTYKSPQILQAVIDLWSLQWFAIDMCIDASSLMGNNNTASKYLLKKPLCNGNLYRLAERNTEHDRKFYWSWCSSLKHLIQMFVNFLGFSWMENWLNGWKFGDSWILIGFLGLPSTFWNVTKHCAPKCPTKMGSAQTLTARSDRKKSGKEVAQRSWMDFSKNKWN